MLMTVPEKPGEAIEGSQFVRDFCQACDTPIRVHPSVPLGTTLCERCGPHTHVRPPASMRAKLSDYEGEDWRRLVLRREEEFE